MVMRLTRTSCLMASFLVWGGAFAFSGGCSSGEAAPARDAGGAGGRAGGGTVEGEGGASGRASGGSGNARLGGNNKPASTGGAGGGGARNTSAATGGAGKGAGGQSQRVGGAGGGASGGAGSGVLPTTQGTCTAVASGDVEISAPSGTFQSSLSVTLSTAVSGAEIRYTTDGKAPTNSSTLYSGAISIAKTTRLRAAAFVGGTMSGAASGALYVARAIDAKHDLPVVILDSYGSGKLPTAEAQRQFVDVAYLAYDLTDGSASLSATPAVSSFAAFHVRGNSSAMFDKVPYRLELRDEAGND